MRLQERLSAVLNYSGLSRSALAERIGVKTYKLQDISRGQTVRMPSDVLDGLRREFPELEPAWLLTGEGSMLRDVAEAVNAGSVVAGRDMQNSGNHTVNNAAPDDLVAALAKSQEQIDRLLGIIERMQQQPEKE